MKQYLGDSVYTELEHGMLKLTTDNGVGPGNTVYLAPEVYVELTRFVDKTAVTILPGDRTDWRMQND